MNSGVKIAIAVVALAVAGYLTWNQLQKKTNDIPDPNQRMMYFQCTGCKHDFEMNFSAYQDAMKSSDGLGSPPCPKCSKTNQVVDVVKCPHCNGSIQPVGHGRMPEKCPLCKKAI